MKKGFFKISNDLVVDCWKNIAGIFKDHESIINKNTEPGDRFITLESSINKI